MAHIVWDFDVLVHDEAVNGGPQCLSQFDPSDNSWWEKMPAWTRDKKANEEEMVRNKNVTHKMWPKLKFNKDCNHQRSKRQVAVALRHLVPQDQYCPSPCSDMHHQMHLPLNHHAGQTYDRNDKGYQACYQLSSLIKVCQA